MAHAGGRPYARLGGRHSRGRGAGRSIRRGAEPRRRTEFKTSRTNDTEDAHEENSIPQEESQSEEETPDTSEGQSASEDEAPEPRQSYSALLQVLKSQNQEEGPVRKRRKIETTSSKKQPDKSLERDGETQEEDSEVEIADAADAALAEDIEDDEDDETNDVTGHGGDDENDVPNNSFERHFAGLNEIDLKRDISARDEKQFSNMLIGENMRKSSIFYGKTTDQSGSKKLRRNIQLKGRLEETGENVFRSLSTEENDVMAEIAGYRDIQFGHRTVSNTSRLRDMACLHALNHVFKTRDRVLKNNAKLSQHEGGDTLDLRDQGFTRPKVLFIVPTKQACVKFVESIAKVSEPDQQENKSRFWETFSRDDDESWDNKTEDFRELFGGNHEEDFRVGLKFTRKTIKYFSGFYNSDMIFGSALGLMRTITTGGGGKDKKKGHDADFLSSIEIVIVDHGAAIQMQNFQHLEYVFTQLNQLPKDSHGCDFARVRNWYLDGNAKYLRQTILFTAHHTPELNSIFSNHTFNIAGLAKYTPTYTGAMPSLPPAVSALSIPQTFLRFDSANPQTDSDARFKFFTTTILQPLLRHNTKGVLIFIPSYFDFVRVRNYLSTSGETTSLSFGSVSEYTSVRDTARARSHFMNGRHSVLIYSERAHHHFRYRIKGVKRIVFYGVPENPVFWGEIVGSLGLNQDVADLESRSGKGAKGIVRAMFSRWDVMKLERIVGTERVGRLVNDRGGDTFEFV